MKCSVRLFGKLLRAVSIVLLAALLLPALICPAKADSAIRVGSSLTFGRYEQDGNPGNGPEDIEWGVLAVEGSKALIISKAVLDAKSFHYKFEPINWETCTLRSWLNGEFYDWSFNDKEKSAIQLSRVTADRLFGSPVDCGNDTYDYVFLFSCDEVTKYLQSTSFLRAYPTKTAIKNEVYVSEDNMRSWWWLRTSSMKDGHVQRVSSEGVFLDVDVLSWNGGVRPVMWIDIDSLRVSNPTPSFGDLISTQTTSSLGSLSLNRIPDLFMSATASSVYQNNGNFKAAHLVDSNESTIWVEGGEGFGIGESITLRFPEVAVRGLEFQSGDYRMNYRYYWLNGRPKEIYIELGETKRALAQLFDSQTNQFVLFSEPVTTDQLTIFLSSFYTEGTKGEDTAITNIWVLY